MLASDQGLKFAIVVVSTSRSYSNDQVIPELSQWIVQQAKGEVVDALIVKDQINSIQEAIISLGEKSAQVILVSGGTGISPDDVTPEALKPLYSRSLPGFDEGMRRYSESKTPYALVSRGVSGIFQEKLVISLPGSPRGAVENINFLLPLLTHSVKKMAGDRTPCQKGHES
ncbi:MAG: MogA/MoaB family molybdenum cofactor biosynthesis protein [Bdellovibrionales bacterium]|jgi:molybdenum cofactor synthesis domain-containing protein|nr:MogA/MoaB family molybdenum cofactor biosynthesis protein [Bdellovibrionales bacterium]MBT3524858.1 MogA/MoaB family molybdenum cofactor biosynthesis protein [Bdellovibrionales bacterium]MBT7669550.1 MogA/MoaB family molybdenum cofactor biosynthesis protein [Bdellovibrionales bacterium]MBT7767221.1 MogA/MoaB family molybdenum cofactor biosynthesis protein [Bdellovibrionales bacterium]